MARARRPVDLQALVDRAEDLARRHGAVPRAEMKSFRPHLGELGPRLVERGLEVGSTIRVPLTAQLLGLAADGAISVKGLERRVAGATSREIKAALDVLVGEERLLAVVRDAGAAFATPSAATLDSVEIRQLLVDATRLVKLLKAAARGDRRVLREDVARLASLGPGARPSTQHRPPPTPTTDEDLIFRIASRVRATSTPTHIPALLRSMGVTAELGRRALLDGAARGLFELEPESGMGRLSREDADLCPPGPMGTRLSWIRARIDQGARS